MTKLEEIARAICCPDADCRCSQPQRIQNSGRICESASYADAARAAIEAMREPTKAMIDYAYKAMVNDTPDESYRNMIDAILNENVEEKCLP